MFAAYISRGQSKPWLIFFSYKRPYCPTAALNFHLFLPTKSSLLFSITRSSSFSVIDVSVNIKNNVEKDTTLLLLFFFFKDRATMWLRCISVAIPVDWIILHWYACGADGLSGGRSVGRCTVTWLPNFLGWVVYIPHFLTHGAPLRALRAREHLYYTLHYTTGASNSLTTAPHWNTHIFWKINLVISTPFF